MKEARGNAAGKAIWFVIFGLVIVSVYLIVQGMMQDGVVHDSRNPSGPHGEPKVRIGFRWTEYDVISSDTRSGETEGTILSEKDGELTILTNWNALGFHDLDDIGALELQEYSLTVYIADHRITPNAFAVTTLRNVLVFVSSSGLSNEDYGFGNSPPTITIDGRRYQMTLFDVGNAIERFTDHEVNIHY